ncbi:MAG: 50S ribosomal protein L2 [Nanoarchaeota archaeon]|nr:50S ribosomal protein L2 [Nanoarchaeota archaeon]
MGKRIISQARGKGSLTYRVKKKAFKHEIKYPQKLEGEGIIFKLVHSAGHSAPLAKIVFSNKVFYTPAATGVYEGQKVKLIKGKKAGEIAALKDLPSRTEVYNIESRPLDGGKFIRSAGGKAVIVKKEKDWVVLLMPSKKQKKFHPDCRVTIGVAAGGGRGDKPVVKAGKKYYIKKAKSKLWPRTSAVSMNAIDHPFGSGRGKNLTHGQIGKIPKRNAPPGAKVGSIRARRTGRGRGGKK